MQFLDERKHGVSSSAYFSYKAEGFTEAEGELEGLISFGKQFGAVHSTLNIAYGQDPEGVERDGELALGLHIEPTRGLFTGVVGRYRDALGSNGDKGTGILRDALGGAERHLCDRQLRRDRHRRGRRDQDADVGLDAGRGRGGGVGRRGVLIATAAPAATAG